MSVTELPRQNRVFHGSFRPIWLATALALLAIGVADQANAQASAFMISSEELVVWDLETLDHAPIGATGILGVSGLAASPSGDLYALSYFTDDLWRVDPANGAATLVGPLGMNVDVASGLAFDACGGLWMVSGSSLFGVDPASGTTSLVAVLTSPDEEIVALTARGDRLLALVAAGPSRQLAWIDPIDGSVERFGSLVSLPTFQVGLDFDQSGRLWAFFWMDGPIPGPWSSSVVEYDPDTGDAVNVVGMVLPPYGGNLAITPPGGACPTVLEVPTLSPLGLVLLSLFIGLAGALRTTWR